MEDVTIHGGFYVESPVRSNDAPKPTANAAGRVEDPSMLTILSDKLDRCMGRIATLENDLGTSKKVMGGAILKLKQEEMEVPLIRKRSTYRRARTQFHTPTFTGFRSTISTSVLSPTVVSEPAASYVALDT
nr:hypothetical protein [Tanacetum cinerariifolium]